MLEHVNLTVRDIDRSIAFYLELLGLELRWEGHTRDGQRAVHVGNEAGYLALFEAPANGAAPRESDYAQVGFNHLGWRVQDLAETRARMAQMGLRPHFEADYEPGRRLYLTDPDGIEVELVEYEAAGGAR